LAKALDYAKQLLACLGMSWTRNQIARVTSFRAWGER
jgi:hypothetical protein